MDIYLSFLTALFVFLHIAEANVDFIAPQQSTIIFPVGSRKGDIQCITIEIVRDSVVEGVETFTEHVNITSPTTAIFGGSLWSSTGSISVNIMNSGKSLVTLSLRMK